MIPLTKRQASSRLTRALSGCVEQMLGYIGFVRAGKSTAPAAALGFEIPIHPEGPNHGVDFLDEPSVSSSSPGGGPPQHWLERVARGAPFLLGTKPDTATQSGEVRRDRDAAGAKRSAPQTMPNEDSLSTSVHQSAGRTRLTSSPSETEVRLRDSLASRASAMAESGLPYRFWKSGAHRLPSGGIPRQGCDNIRAARTENASGPSPELALTSRFSALPNLNAPEQAGRGGLPNREPGLSNEHGSMSTVAVAANASSSDLQPQIKPTPIGPGLRFESSHDDNRCLSKLVKSNKRESWGYHRSGGTQDPVPNDRKATTANSKTFQSGIVPDGHSLGSEKTQDLHDTDQPPRLWPELGDERENSACGCSSADDRWPDLPEAFSPMLSGVLEQDTLQRVSNNPRRSHQARVDREQQGLIWNG